MIYPVMLIAHGPNSVTVPCRLFPSMDDARAFMESRFGQPQKWDKATKQYVEEPGGRKWPIRNEEDERVTALFTSYYGGCGGVGLLTLEPVDFNTPFVPWDLD